MFDGLDDPTPPAAGPDERAAVAARAGRIRRRRIYSASGGTLAVVAAVAIAVAQSGGGTSGLVGPASGVATSDPTPTAVPPTTAAPQPSHAPTTSPPPPTNEPTARPTTHPPAPAPSAEPTYAGPPDGTPPARHSWSTGYTACSVKDPGASTAPAPGLRLHLELPGSTYTAGDDIKGTLVVTNESGASVTFTVSHENTDDGTLIADSGWAASARFSTDAVALEDKTVAPGQSVRLPVTIRTTSCGVAQGTYDPLPAGHYRAMAELHWNRTGGGYGEWWSPLVPVTLT